MTKDEQGQFYKNLGESIKAIRKNKQITQEALANYLGLSRVSVVNIENGRQKPLVHTLIEMSLYLKVPVSELLGHNTVNDLDQSISDKVNRRARQTESAEIMKTFSKLYSKDK
jgi:transcriptional regulator with XRE-family HTH domain